MIFGIIKFNRNIKKMQNCYMDTDRFIIYIKTEGFYKDIADGVKNRYDPSNYETDRPLPKVMNEKVIGLIKDKKTGGKVIT